MAAIHLIGGEKGGVGKSLVARLLAQYLIDRGLPFAGFDTDRSHGALLRFYAGYATPVEVERPDTLDPILETAIERPDHRVLVDLAAQTQAPLLRWLAEAGAHELLDEHGVTLHCWHVMDAGRDSVDLLAKSLEAHGERVRHVLVRNQLRGDDFRLLDASPALAQARAWGAREMTLRRLAEAPAQRIDAASLSFWAAAQAGEAGGGLGLVDRQRLKTWLRDAYAGFEQVGV
ncbi:mobilization protein [Piscinibacter sakaiensis]|uniref:Mobilization protein n=1 Tax=Piscinibacter sakaiensis TaxID=1547922 RepID=A0A0K8P754_PISS1|nr:mobilization protein [Piscinibacter sakaiensis]GAP38447.1 hypothetical protein ISF6_4905 [Piscinibacter sakaiensis]